MNLRVIAFSFLMCILFHANAQVRSLSIGDEMPDLKFEMLDYKNPTANLSDFRGKLLILDFWSTWCTSCIAKFPELVSIQKKFGDKVMILPVGFDAYREGSIKAFLTKRNSEKKPINLPSALQKDSDTLLMKLIPFRGLPHEVWIDTAGKIIAITYSEEVNEKNVNNYFHGKLEELPLKYWDPNFDMQKPLLLNGNGGPDENFLYRSIITNHNPRVQLDVRQNSPQITRLGMANRLPLDLIKLATELTYKGEFSRIISFDHLNKRVSADSVLLHRMTKRGDNTMTPVQRQGYNLFCYDLTLPGSFSRADAGKKMLLDLENFFGVKVSSKIDKVNCLVLVRTSQKDKIKMNSQLKKSEKQVDPGLELKNATLQILVSYFNQEVNIPFVIDETGYDFKVDIELKISKSDDLERIRKALRNYDLDLLPVVRELEMLVLEEN